MYFYTTFIARSLDPGSKNSKHHSQSGRRWKIFSRNWRFLTQHMVKLTPKLRRYAGRIHTNSKSVDQRRLKEGKDFFFFYIFFPFQRKTIHLYIRKVPKTWNVTGLRKPTHDSQFEFFWEGKIRSMVMLMEYGFHPKIRKQIIHEGIHICLCLRISNSCEVGL